MKKMEEPPRSVAEASAGEAQPPAEEERRKIGSLSDYCEDGGPQYYPTAEELLAQLARERDRNAEVDVERERASLGVRLEQVTALLEKERSLSAVRGELGTASSKGESAETVEKLEEVKEKLEGEQEQVDLAAEFNDVLEHLSGLSDEEVEHIAQTGRTKEGKALRSKRGADVHHEVAKHLARLAASGVRRVTWGALRKLSAVVDAVLHDVASAVKGVLGIGAREHGDSAMPRRST